MRSVPGEVETGRGKGAIHEYPQESDRRCGRISRNVLRAGGKTGRQRAAVTEHRDYGRHEQ